MIDLQIIVIIIIIIKKITPFTLIHIKKQIKYTSSNFLHLLRTTQEKRWEYINKWDATDEAQPNLKEDIAHLWNPRPSEDCLALTQYGEAHWTLLKMST